MKAVRDYISALNGEGLFENFGHMSRFKELMDCFFGFPFFTKGLCKCIYLSAWDEEHFVVMLETLNAMSLGREQNTNDMRIQGDTLAQECASGEHYIYQLSCAFLDNRPFRLEEDAVIDDSFRYIITRALQASKVIDNV